MSFIRIVCLVAALIGVCMAGSIAPIWSGTTLIETKTITMVQSSFIKLGLFQVSYSNVFSGTPKMFMGAFKVDSASASAVSWLFHIMSPTQTNYQVGYLIGLANSISSINVYSLAVDPTITYLYVTLNVDFSGSYSAVSGSSGPRNTSMVVNFQADTGQSVNTSHTLKMMLFMQGVRMAKNSGDFDVDSDAAFLNSTHYQVNLYTSGATTVQYYRFSLCIYDQTVVQRSEQTFVLGDYITALSNNWAALTITLPFKSTTNFMVALASMSYAGTAAFKFIYTTTGTITCSGASTFIRYKFGYWNYMYRTCPVAYPYFTQTTNLCYDVCPSNYWVDGTYNLCMLCSYSCVTCLSSTVCLSCDASTHRTLVSGICACPMGQYDPGVALCASCLPTCETCTTATTCATCSSAAYRSLSGGQCVCASGYYESGGACFSCGVTGCQTCTSPGACTICDASLHFTLAGSSCNCLMGYYLSGSDCLSCAASMPGCTDCSVANICATCDVANHFTPAGNNCSCDGGYYLSGGTCVSCISSLSGCTVCVDAATCSNCDTLSNFVASGLGCTCLANHYESSPTLCSVCPTVAGCLQCSDASTCSTCDTAQNFVLTAGVCDCQLGYYLDGSVCSACSSIPGCVSCTSSIDCTGCVSPAAVVSGGCACPTGYYPSATGCSICAAAIPGCLSCTSATSCDSCDAMANFDPTSPVCSCKSGYFRDADNKCKPCPTGCLTCISSSDSSNCDTANHFIANIGSCICDTGYLLVSGTCQPCGLYLPGCIDCSSATVCNSCETVATDILQKTTSFTCQCLTSVTYSYDSATHDCVSCVGGCCPYDKYWDGAGCSSCNTLYGSGCKRCDSGGCSLCDVGTYNSGGVCTPCGNPHCLVCNGPGSCTLCNTADHFIVAVGACVCDGGYAVNLTDAAMPCVACSAWIDGCLTCSDAGTCVTCDLAANFIPALGDTCACKTGYYLSGGVCVPCTIVGCYDCSDASVCVQCDSTNHFVPTVLTCACDTGYYDQGGTCLSCSVMVGCLECSDATTCTTCDAANSFSYNSSSLQCSCASSYYASGSSCLACPTGCLDCTASTCTNCDIVNGFTLSSGTCICTGYSTGASCVGCNSITPNCTSCSSGTCSLCSAPTVLTGSVCSCAAGTYDDGTTCATCSSQFNGCTTCTSGTCSACNTVSGFELTPVANTCLCTPLHVLVGSNCELCSATMPGCTSCTSTSVCTACDLTAGFALVGSSCTCNSSSFVNSLVKCQTCSSAIHGCSSCSANSGIATCTTCDTAANFALHSGACQCADTYTLVAGNCISCLIACDCYGYQQILGVCQPVCSDGITVGSEECDDGNLIPGDGCSATCTIEPGYVCKLDIVRLSTCVPSQHLSFNMINLFKNPIANKLTFVINLTIGNTSQIPTTPTVNLSSIIATPTGLSNPAYTYQDGQLLLTYDFNQSVHGNNVTFNVLPAAGFLYQGSFTVPIVPTNNLPAVIYADHTYEKTNELSTVYDALVYSSYGLLAIGFVSNAIVPIELFGLLQLAHIETSNLNGVDPPLFPIMNSSIVHGYNVKLNSQQKSVPVRVAAVQYGPELIGNVNVMIGLVLLELLAAGIVFAVGKFVPKFQAKSVEIASAMVKKYLLVLVIFNTFNIGYSTGLQLVYASPSDPYFGLSVGSTVVAMLLPIGTIAILLFSSTQGFGEFSDTLKNSSRSKMYFAASILYRLVLGLMAGALNDTEQATIVGVFVSIVFVLAAISNKPFKSSYHNYRAATVHLSELVVVSVTMYYRSMKSNTPLAETSMLFAPAFLELAAILTTIGVSTAVTGYELYLKVKEWIDKAQMTSPEAQKKEAKPDKKEEHLATIMNLFDESGVNTVAQPKISEYTF